MNKTLTDLLPCPFCGGTNCTVSTRTIGKWKFVYCPDCLAEGPADDMEVVAVADWNRRAHPGQPEQFTLTSALEWAGVPDACRKEPETHAEMTDGWQPIETAPKDGTEVVLLFDDEVALLGKTRPRVRAASWLVDWTIPYRRDNPPTHWMPLPAAPADAAGAGDAS